MDPAKLAIAVVTKDFNGIIDSITSFEEGLPYVEFYYSLSLESLTDYLSIRNARRSLFKKTFQYVTTYEQIRQLFDIPYNKSHDDNVINHYLTTSFRLCTDEEVKRLLVDYRISRYSLIGLKTHFRCVCQHLIDVNNKKATELLWIKNLASSLEDYVWVFDLAMTSVDADISKIPLYGMFYSERLPEFVVSEGES